MKSFKAEAAVGLLLGAALLALASPSRAAFDDVGVGARATGLGDALTAASDDAYSLVYNPAGLGLLKRPELATTYARLFMGLSDGSSLQNSFLAFAHPLGPGAVGASYNIFSLDSLYQERTASLGYGLALPSGPLPGKLYGGASAKLLSRSLSDVPQATQPLDANGQVVPGRTDPVLESPSRTVPDFDLGLVYSPRERLFLGLDLRHLFTPDISFVGAGDKLGREARLGAAYKTPWTVLAADLDFTPSPDGGTDSTVVVAAEKWLPTLLYGSFGLRASLATGSRDFQQVTAGLSYRIHRLQFDYGFQMPLGTVRGTSGSHRLGLTLFFGEAAGGEEDLRLAILENMERLPKDSPEYALKAREVALYESAAARDIMAMSQGYVLEGDFASALAKVKSALTLRPNDEIALKRQARLETVVRSYPRLADFRADPVKDAIYEGIVEFVYGSEKEAAGRLERAYALAPQDARLAGLLAAVRVAAGSAPAPAPPPAGPGEAARSLARLSDQAEAALKAGDYGEARRLSRRILESDPSNSAAYLRLAAAAAGLKEYAAALQAVDQAEKVETNESLKGAIRSYRRSLESLAAAKPPPRQAEDVGKLYEAGVELYSHGRREEARELFKKILELDPANAPARRALDRIESELKSP